MDEDISRNTIFVLVILTLLISAVGTWTVLMQINTNNPAAPATVHATSGQVSFTISPPAKPASAGATGQVAFELHKG